MMNEIRIFLVDDHAVVREGLYLLLNAQSDMIVIGEASEGNEALLKIPQAKPDIVIMDLSMPNGRSGLPTIIEIVQKFPDMKVLTLTMHDDQDSLFRALKAGASGYMLKSSVGQELVTAIRQVHSGQAYLYPGAQKKVIEHVFHDTGEDLNDSFDLLSEREKEIFSLVAKGYTNKEIGELLNISPRTVETHKSKIMEKLKLSTRRDLVQFALRRGLLDD